MQPKYLAIFTFVYISKKKTPFFGELNGLSHFWTFIFVQKGKTERLLENDTFYILYILLIFILKENRNIYSTDLFFGNKFLQFTNTNLRQFNMRFPEIFRIRPYKFSVTRVEVKSLVF